MDWVFEEHIQYVAHVCYSSAVPFGLPEFGLQIFQAALPCRNVNLVERCIDGYRPNFSLGFPESLDGSVAVLSYGVSTGVPEADSGE